MMLPKCPPMIPRRHVCSDQLDDLSTETAVSAGCRHEESKTNSNGGRSGAFAAAPSQAAVESNAHENQHNQTNENMRT